MIKFLFDTSTLVAALVEFHPKHTLALPCLQRVKKCHTATKEWILETISQLPNSQNLI